MTTTNNKTIDVYTNTVTTSSVSIYDHIKINIEQSAKGARVTVTYDRSDHDIDTAVAKSVETYKKTLEMLKQEKLKVDES